jgi:hypothetical protein
LPSRSPASMLPIASVGAVLSSFPSRATPAGHEGASPASSGYGKTRSCLIFKQVDLEGILGTPEGCLWRLAIWNEVVGVRTPEVPPVLGAARGPANFSRFVHHSSLYAKWSKLDSPWMSMHSIETCHQPARFGRSSFRPPALRGRQPAREDTSNFGREGVESGASRKETKFGATRRLFTCPGAVPVCVNLSAFSSVANAMMLVSREIGQRGVTRNGQSPEPALAGFPEGLIGQPFTAGLRHVVICSPLQRASRTGFSPRS